MKFLDYSRSSIAETISHCYVAMDQNYINPEEMEKVKDKADNLWKKINNFISYLNQTHRQKHQISKQEKTNQTN